MIYPRIQSVIDVLSTVDPNNFCMASTTLCIAGHCKKLGFQDGTCCDEIFMYMTGVNKRIAVEVVYPDAEDSTYIGCDATLQQAIKLLEHLRDNGIVNWSKAMEKVS